MPDAKTTTKRSTAKATVIKKPIAHKTFSAKPSDVKRDWLLIDASQTTLGRLSTQIATLLTGKHKPTYTPHIDCGDYVVVVNSDKIQITGGKLLSKKYYRHSGFPGAIKEITLEKQLQKDSTEVIYKSVKGMLPKNKLASERLKRLKIFIDDNHTHEPQKPQKVEVK